MKLKTSQYKTTVSSDFQEYQFGIRSSDMGIILEILRSKMYKNPIAAVCREISSNSRDANREAGNHKTPVRIQFDSNLFSPGETTLSFIDDGPGISVERISDVFIHYGASTKRGDNKQTGAFGLGSKTPFSYTDSFTIATRVGGTKYTYVAAIDESNTGKIFEVSQEETFEPNGTSIIIPIKDKDRDEFEEEIFKTTLLWEVRPEYINFMAKIPEIKVTNVHGNYMVLEGLNHCLFENNCYLLIDHIPYNLSGNDVGIEIGENMQSSLFLTFKTGSLTISATRETVQYDPNTIKLINKRYEDLIYSFRSNIEQRIFSCGFYVDSVLAYLDSIQGDYVKEDLFSCLEACCKDTFKHGESEVDRWIGLSWLKISKISRSAKTQGINQYEPGLKQHPIYAVDTYMRTAGRDATILASNEAFYAVELADKNVRNFSKLPFSRKRRHAESMRKALNELEGLKKIGLTLKSYTSVLSTRVARAVRQEVIPDSIPVRVEEGGYRQQFKMKRIRLSLIPSDSCYVVLEDDEEKNSHRRKWAKFFSRHTFYFIKAKYEKLLKGKMESYDDFMKELKTKDMVKLSTKKYIEENRRIDHNIIGIVSGLSIPTIPADVLEEFCSYQKVANPGHLPDNFTSTYPVDPKMKDALKEVINFLDKCPLLESLSFGYSMKKKDHKHVQMYVDAVYAADNSGK